MLREQTKVLDIKIQLKARNDNGQDTYVGEGITDGPPPKMTDWGITDIKDPRKTSLDGVMKLSLWSVNIEKSCCIHNLCEDLAHAQEFRGLSNELCWDQTSAILPL